MRSTSAAGAAALPCSVAGTARRMAEVANVTGAARARCRLIGSSRGASPSDGASSSKQGAGDAGEDPAVGGRGDERVALAHPEVAPRRLEHHAV